MRLTVEQLARVEAELTTARWVAARYRTGLLTFEERLSAAHLGLCLAARRWERRASFRTYAEHRMLGQIRRDIQLRLRRHGREVSLSDEDIDGLAAPTAGEPPGVPDCLSILPEGDREAFARIHLQGQSCAEAARGMGCSRSGAHKSAARALARLRAAALGPPR